MRLADALDSYLLQLQADGRSPHTLDQAARHLERFRTWLSETSRNDETAAITHEVVAAFFVSDAARLRPDGAPKKPTALNALRSTLRTFFRYAHAAGLVAADPTRLLRRARCGPAPPRALAAEDQRRLLDALSGATDAAGKRDHLLFALMLATGIRLGSALALTIEDVDLGAGEAQLRTTKNSRPDRVYLPPKIVDHLRAFMGSRCSGPLFVGRAGKALDRRHGHRRLKFWLATAEVRRSASPHSLRHSFASDLYRQTGDVLLVMRALHHRSVSSTIVYAGPGRAFDLARLHDPVLAHSRSTYPCPSPQPTNGAEPEGAQRFAYASTPAAEDHR